VNVSKVEQGVVIGSLGGVHVTTSIGIGNGIGVHKP